MFQSKSLRYICLVFWRYFLGLKIEHERMKIFYSKQTAAGKLLTPTAAISYSIP